MALAIIEFILFDRNHAQFKIDTGTNSFYRVKIGRSVSERNEIEWVDEVSHTTPFQKSSSGDSLLNTTRNIALPSGYFDKDNCYIQLFSFKSIDGKSPAFSKVLKIPVGFKNAVRGDYLLSMSQNLVGMTNTEFNDCRKIQDESALYSKQESLEDLLFNGLKAVAPIVLELISGAQNSANGTNTVGKTESPLQPGVLNNLLQTLLHGFTSLPAIAAPVSKPSSLAMSDPDDNRFEEGSQEYSRPFIFGIDDALLATLAGPIIQQGLQVLPQLLSSMNQKKIQTQAANNKLITDILADTNKRLMLQQLLQNQAQAGTTQANNANVTQLLQLLQQTATAAPAEGQPAANVAPGVTQSLSFSVMPAFSLSTTANLVFETVNTLQWNGIKKALYNKNNPAAFKIKLAIPDPAPKSPLSKCIFKFYFRETGDQKAILEKTFKQKNVIANSFIDFLITKEELAALPANKSLMVFAEIRWLTQSNKELKALGSTEIVLVNSYFIKEVGKTISEERELNDMKVYRSFWNKIWEAPVLDAASQKKNETKKYQWELNANLKYAFTLTESHEANGMLETKMLKAVNDPDSMTEKAEGRMKAGIELSIAELNKLCTRWDKQNLLPDLKLEALKSTEFAKSNASELIYNLKLKGKAGQRGMVWIVPVLKLVSIKLNKVKTSLASGLVNEVEEEIVQFPVPVAGRIIGLKSA